jgi:hypothetical protein
MILASSINFWKPTGGRVEFSKRKRNGPCHEKLRHRSPSKARTPKRIEAELTASTYRPGVVISTLVRPE